MWAISITGIRQTGMAQRWPDSTRTRRSNALGIAGRLAGMGIMLEGATDNQLGTRSGRARARRIWEGLGEGGLSSRGPQPESCGFFDVYTQVGLFQQ